MLNTIKLICIIVISGAFFASCNNKNKETLQQIKFLEYKVDSLEKVYYDIDIEYLKKIYSELTKNTEFLKANFVIIGELDTAVTKYVYAYRNLTKRMNRSFKHGGLNIGAGINLRQQQLANLKHDIKHDLLNDTAEIQHFIEIERKAVVDLVVSSKVIFSQFKTEKEHYYQLKDSVNVIIERTKHRIY